MTRPPTTEQTVIRHYKSGATVTEVAARCDLKRGKVYSILTRNRVKMRPRGKRPLPVNHHFFDDIDTEIKAYWLGWLSVSGHTENGNMISISMKTDDHLLLESFKAVIQSEHKIHRRKSQPIVRLRFQSEHMARQLNEYGIPDRRTFNQTAVKVPDHLSHHYWRGVIDANGSVYIMLSQKKYPTLMIKVCTSEAICLAFSRWIRSIGYNTLATPSKSLISDTWGITVGGTVSVLPILLLLYAGVSIFMPRHKESLDQWRAQSNDNSNW